jgi:AcrR family transcriptional regulator
MPKVAAAAPPVTKERVLVEAAKMFSERGYAASTTRELARRLGIQPASLYHHIATKEQLLQELCLQSARQIDGAVRAAVARHERPVERLEAAARAHLETTLADLDLHTTALVETRALSPKARKPLEKARSDYEHLIRQLIGDAQGGGYVRAEIDPKWLSLSLLNLLNWSIFWYQPGVGIAAPELTEILLGIYLRGALVDRRATARTRCS